MAGMAGGVVESIRDSDHKGYHNVTALGTMLISNQYAQSKKYEKTRSKIEDLRNW